MARTHGKLTDLLLNGSGLRSRSHAVELTHEIDTAEDTVFASDGKEFLEGKVGATASVSAYFDGDAGEIDERLNALIGAAGLPVLSIGFGGLVAASNDIAYSGECELTRKPLTSPVAGAVTLDVDAQFSKGALRSFVAYRATAGAGAGSTASKDAQTLLGIVPADCKLFGAALQVEAKTGTIYTLDVIVKESATGAFLGEEVTLVTFSQVTTAPTALWMTASGARLRYWKVYYTVGGTGTPTFTVCVTLGAVVWV